MRCLVVINACFLLLRCSENLAEETLEIPSITKSSSESIKTLETQETLKNEISMFYSDSVELETKNSGNIFSTQLTIKSGSHSWVDSLLFYNEFGAKWSFENQGSYVGDITHQLINDEDFIAIDFSESNGDSYKNWYHLLPNAKGLYKIPKSPKNHKIRNDTMNLRTFSSLHHLKGNTFRTSIQYWEKSGIEFAEAFYELRKNELDKFEFLLTRFVYKTSGEPEFNEDIIVFELE